MDIDTLIKELDINAIALKQALAERSVTKVSELLTQRNNLKDMLIELLMSECGVIKMAA